MFCMAVSVRACIGLQHDRQTGREDKCLARASLGWKRCPINKQLLRKHGFGL